MELPIDTKNITIPDHIIRKFQSTVNIMADIIQVPAALIMKVESPYIDVFFSSESSDNPFKSGDRYRLAGVYCEKGIDTKKKLLVPNALKDKEWDSNPDLEYGMVSYLGFPLVWPNGEVFGTICVSDTKENEYGEKYEMLMLQFKELVEAHFALLYQNYELQDKTNRLQKSLQEVKFLYEDLKLEKEKTKTLTKALEDKYGLGNIVGKNHKMQAIYDLIEDISQSDSTVLIQGESGTGKELIARAIHLLSPRKERPFVVANCSAYAQNLLESELFGHEKGAFTGAIRRKKGRFELADGGTIFLDEIGEIPSTTQLLLLRVLQEKKFERVGGEDTLKVDIRVIAATNRNLNQEMMEGRFREDLYYRLNVIPITLPPLRERKDDVPLLAEYFLEIYSNANSKYIRGFSEEVMQIFLDYDWPGNVRELQNVAEHAVILAKGEVITEIDLPHNLKETIPRAEADISSLKDTERNLILKVLRETKGNKYQAAKKLGITRSTLYGKLRKHGIVMPSND
jgi:two-component system response regulator HydG